MKRRIWRLAVFLFILGFTLNLAGIVSHVVVSSLAKRWFATPLPGAFTTEWYAYSWREFQLADVLTVTATVAVTVTALALLLGFPAAYVLARRGFRAKNAVLLLYFLPLLIPQMTYGIPLATSLYRYRIGGTVAGVILANLVPMLPLAIFVLLPFIEQISETLEWAARVHGAGRWQVFRRVVLPLVVALYYAVFAAGMRPIYSVDAMAVIYMAIVLVMLLVALRFVRPTQMVFRLGGK